MKEIATCETIRFESLTKCGHEIIDDERSNWGFGKIVELQAPSELLEKYRIAAEALHDALLAFGSRFCVRRLNAERSPHALKPNRKAVKRARPLFAANLGQISLKVWEPDKYCAAK
jgi:hypothetical protein